MHAYMRLTALQLADRPTHSLCAKRLKAKEKCNKDSLLNQMIAVWQQFPWFEYIAAVALLYCYWSQCDTISTQSSCVHQIVWAITYFITSDLMASNVSYISFYKPFDLKKHSKHHNFRVFRAALMRNNSVWLSSFFLIYTHFISAFLCEGFPLKTLHFTFILFI